MQERVFYLRLSTEPKLTLNLYINAISIKITQNIYPLLSSKMKRTEQQEYINIPLPIGLAKEIDDIIKEGEFGYKTKSEFVKEAVREKLGELINLITLKIEYKKTKKP